MEANTDYYRLFDFTGFIREKNWGNTLRLEGLNANDLHIAKVIEHSQSSVHCHHKLYNFIYNINSIFYINFPDKDLQLEIQEGFAIEIAPGIKHQFYSQCYGYIIESYYEEPLRSVSHLDIERFPNE